MNLTRSLLAITAVGVCMSAAEASTYTVGTLSTTPYLNTVNVPFGSFTDIYNFSVAVNSSESSSVTNIPLALFSIQILDISSLSLSVFDASNNLLASGASFSIVAPAGSYHADVTGTATGTNGGGYTIALAAQPVPLPPALWLFSSGLLGLVGLARRR